MSNIIGKLEGHLGKFTVTPGKEYKYLGIKIRFVEGGKVSISMTKQIKEMYENFSKKIDGAVTSPATQRLYEVTQCKSFLSGQCEQELHSVVQQLLYLTKRGRSDIETVVAFLCTRVKKAQNVIGGNQRGF